MDNEQEMKVDDIIDPLVRVAFTKKRDADLLQQAADSTLKNIQAMQEEHAYQLSEAADSRAELQALMAAMTPRQHEDLVMAELTYHHASVQRAQRGASKLIQSGSITAAQLRSVYSQTQMQSYLNSGFVSSDPLGLLKDADILNDLQLVWRK